MERLTKRLSNGEVMHNCGKCSNVNKKDFCSEKNCATVILNRLAELEDKLESGQLVELPCIMEVQDLDSVRYDICFKRTEPPYKGSLDFYVRKTREQAEAKLKELQEKKR